MSTALPFRRLCVFCGSRPGVLPAYQEAARDLGNTLGRGCRIVSGKKKGRIELEYYGVDDLNELLEALHTIKKP